MTRLFVVRHGETDYNRDGRYQGSIDVSLNPRGRDQARQTAAYLESHDIAHLVSSPLKRARETARIISGVLNVEVEYMAGFVERNLGVLEGKTKEEFAEHFPGIWDESPTRQIFDAPDGAESLAELSIRVHSSLDLLKRQYTGTCVALICHGGVARTINGLLRRVPDTNYFDYRLKNGETDCFDL